jgi:hypothetical protein
MSAHLQPRSVFFAAVNLACLARYPSLLASWPPGCPRGGCGARNGWPATRAGPTAAPVRSRLTW